MASIDCSSVANGVVLLTARKERDCGQGLSSGRHNNPTASIEAWSTKATCPKSLLELEVFPIALNPNLSWQSTSWHTM